MDKKSVGMQVPFVESCQRLREKCHDAIEDDGASSNTPRRLGKIVKLRCKQE